MSWIWTNLWVDTYLSWSPFTEYYHLSQWGLLRDKTSSINLSTHTLELKYGSDSEYSLSHFIVCLYVQSSTTHCLYLNLFFWLFCPSNISTFLSTTVMTWRYSVYYPARLTTIVSINLREICLADCNRLLRCTKRTCQAKFSLICK